MKILLHPLTSRFQPPFTCCRWSRPGRVRISLGYDHLSSPLALLLERSAWFVVVVVWFSSLDKDTYTFHQAELRLIYLDTDDPNTF